MTLNRCDLLIPVETWHELEQSATLWMKRDDRERGARRPIKKSAWAISLHLAGPYGGMGCGLISWTD